MTLIHEPGRGDRLASGAKSATFTMAKPKFDEGQMMDDLRKMTSAPFCEKYMITSIEYDQLFRHALERAKSPESEEVINDFAQTMRARREALDRELAADDAQDASLSRECFIEPRPGSVIVSRDVPLKPKSTLLLPPKKDRNKELLPTTGHVIKIGVGAEAEYGCELLGKRVIFQQMSGQAICFKGYPTWIELTTSEIMGIVQKEDAEVLDTPLEAMV